MNTYADLAEFKEKLISMSKEQLIEAISEYAQSDTVLYRHFLTLAKMSQPNADCLSVVKKQIDAVYGNENLGDKFDFNGKVQFKNIPDLIENLFNSGKFDETIKASEHAFSYDFNIATVQDPDDFMDTCFFRIIDCWLKAQVKEGQSQAVIEQIIAKQDDEHGLSTMMKRRMNKLLNK